MTPAQQVALDAMRQAWPEETVQRMMRQTKLGVQWLAREWVSGPRRKAVVPSGWIDREHWDIIPDEFFDFEREGRPVSVPWRATINEAGERVDGLTHAPPTRLPASHVCSGPRADCWCASRTTQGRSVRET